MNFSSSPFFFAFILLLDKKVDKKENDKSLLDLPALINLLGR